MATISRDAQGHVTIGGVPRLVLLTYDSGFAGSSSTDMAGHIAARNLSRFANKLNAYIQIYTGTLGNALRLADALVPLNMYTFAIGNAVGGSTVEANSAGNGPFDVFANPTYTTSPEGTGP